MTTKTILRPTSFEYGTGIILWLGGHKAFIYWEPNTQTGGISDGKTAKRIDHSDFKFSGIEADDYNDLLIMISEDLYYWNKDCGDIYDLSETCIDPIDFKKMYESKYVTCFISTIATSYYFNHSMMSSVKKCRDVQETNKDVLYKVDGELLFK